MKVINKSRKIISIAGEPFLPGKDMELAAGLENHPVIKDYMAKGIIVDAEKAVATAGAGISDLEKAKIAEEAVAQYIAKQEALAAAQAEREAEIKAVKAMKKDELLTKAAGMGIEVEDGETADSVREKVLAALNQ